MLMIISKNICNDIFRMGMPSQRITPKVIATPNYIYKIIITKSWRYNITNS